MKNPLEKLRSVDLSKVKDADLKKEASFAKEKYSGKDYDEISKAGQDNIKSIIDLVKDIYPKALPTEKKGLTPAKPAKKAAKKAPKKAAPKKKAARITIVGDKEYNLDDCDEAKEAIEARRKQRQSSDSKYEKRPDTTKAKKNLDSAIGQVGDALKGADPATAKKALREFKLKMNSAFSALAPVLNKEQVKRLKSSLSAIDEIIKEIK